MSDRVFTSLIILLTTLVIFAGVPQIIRFWPSAELEYLSRVSVLFLIGASANFFWEAWKDGGL